MIFVHNLIWLVDTWLIDTWLVVDYRWREQCSFGSIIIMVTLKETLLWRTTWRPSKKASNYRWTGETYLLVVFLLVCDWYGVSREGVKWSDMHLVNQINLRLLIKFLLVYPTFYPPCFDLFMKLTLSVASVLAVSSRTLPSDMKRRYGDRLTWQS